MLDMIKDFVRAALTHIPEHVPIGYRPYLYPESCKFDKFEIVEHNGQLRVFFPKNGLCYNEVSLAGRLHKAAEAGGDYPYSSDAYYALIAAKRAMQPQ